MDDDSEHKKAKGTKKYIIKRELMFKNDKESLFNNKIILRSQQGFRTYNHKVHTEEVNKIALSSNDDKRLQTFDGITTYPIGTNAFKVCESEMLSKNKLSRLDEDKNTPKDKDKTTPKTMTKTEDKDKDKDKNIPKTIVKTEDKNKTTPKTKTKTKTEDKDKDKTIPKTKTKTKTEDKNKDKTMPKTKTKDKVKT